MTSLPHGVYNLSFLSSRKYKAHGRVNPTMSHNGVKPKFKSPYYMEVTSALRDVLYVES